MWLACTAIGAVTRAGIGYTPDQSLLPYDCADRLAVPEFDVKTELGRKGSSTLDRLGMLALLAARDCLGRVADVPDGTGVTVVTTVGSMRSTLEFSGITITGPKPWNVPPSLFPNTVMNAAAGIVAIRHALTGPNTTIAGGKAGGLKALCYVAMLAETALLTRCLLVCAEELTEQRAAWSGRLDDRPIGEAAVAFLLGPDDGSPREFRVRMREGDIERVPGTATIVAGAAATANAQPADDDLDPDLVDVEQVFGVLDAATFGCQVLLALSLLRSGAYTRAVVPFPDARRRGYAEVEL